MKKLAVSIFVLATLVAFVLAPAAHGAQATQAPEATQEEGVSPILLPWEQAPIDQHHGATCSNEDTFTEGIKYSSQATCEAECTTYCQDNGGVYKHSSYLGRGVCLCGCCRV